jgi:UDP-N-acetylmuramoylalanine--D-glutamate ligase
VATVLLSPAAASFDQFPDYAARGRAFKDLVAALAAVRSATRAAATDPSTAPTASAPGR